MDMHPTATFALLMSSDVIKSEDARALPMTQGRTGLDDVVYEARYFIESALFVC